MNATEPMLSALLGWSQAARRLSPREVDGGLPTIVSVDLRLNEPRYASLPNIMKAKAKPLALKTPADCGVDVTPRPTVLKITEPAGSKAAVKLASAGELIAKLTDEAGVI